MKTRRRFITRLSGITAMLALGTVSRANDMTKENDTNENQKKLEGGFIHMVFFWLVDDSPAVKKTFLKELNQFISQVDEIKKSHIGPPANTDRDVIDNTYSYNLVLTFDSKKAHDIYQAHPLHKQFIENASSLWSRVQVYDSDMNVFK